MSAHAGLLYRDGRPVEREALLRMARPLSHRGPGEPSIWYEGSVGVVSRTLSTSAEPASPGIASIDAAVIVADARLDNRGELAAALSLSGRDPSMTDADLILEAYRAWGRETPSRLIGDFAFAIWDRARQALFCARDSVGVRPFVYYASDRVFAFASEIKALLGIAEVPRELDEVQVAFFLDGFIDDPERTFYREIRRLPAAHWLEVSPGTIRMQRYWSPDPGREIRYPSTDDYAEAFRETFLEAVRSRLRNADPVGGALSGGLDSSSIVRAARRLLPRDQPMHAFSAVFPDLPEEEREANDESPFIDAVVAIDGIVSHRIRVDRVRPLADYDRVFHHLDSPPLGFNLYMHWALFGAARDAGVRVFLDGTDGDSVVSSGYQRFIDLARAGDWSTVVREVKALSRRYETPASWFLGRYVYPQLDRISRQGRLGNWLRASSELSAGLGRSKRNLLLRHGVGAFVPRGLSARVRARGARANGTRPLIRSDFARRTGLRERKRTLLPEDTVPSSSGREAHARALALPRYQFAMEVIDGAASAFGIEPRYPFFDRRMVEFCVGIPSELKLEDGWTRWVMRRAMEGILPPEVQWRLDKGNLSHNFVRGMHAEGASLQAALFGEPQVLGEFVELRDLRATYDRFLSSEPSAEVNQDAMSLYQATVLARWLKEHRPGASV